MSEAALSRIAQLIKQEDDLFKVNGLKQQFLKEKSAIDVELNQSIQIQIESIMRNINNLNDSGDELAAVKTNMNRISNIYRESQQSISRYDLIKEMTEVNNYFTQANDLYNDILNFNKFLNYVNQLIDSDQEIDIDAKVPNLLKVHYNLNSARNFADNLIALSKTTSDDLRSIISKIVNPIYITIKKFDLLLAELIMGMTESLKSGNLELVLKIIKIIEYEETEDLKLKLMERLSSNDIKVKVSNLKLQQRKSKRMYYEFFFHKLDDSIKEIFKNCEESFENKLDVLDNLDWLFNDLIFIKEQLVELTPKRWDIFNFFNNCYYKYLNRFVLKLVEAEPPAEELLKILSFDNFYADTLQNELGVPKAQIKSVIGNDLKETLLDDYLKLIVTKMNEWMLTLQKTEQDVFNQRNIPPETDANGKLGLQGSVIVFQMFNQQAEVAADSGYGKILNGVVQEFGKLLITRQEVWKSIVNREITSLISGADINPGLIEYLIALSNDQMNGAEHTEFISYKYSKLVSRKYQTEIESSLNNTIDGFADLAKYCVDGLILLMFNDMKKVFDLIFSKQWYNDNIVPQISDTIMEYLSDFKDPLNEYLFDLVVGDVLELTLLNYFQALKYGHDFKPKKINSMITRDVEIFYKLFAQFLDGETIQAKFKVFEHLLDLIGLEKDDIPAKWEEVLVDFNDCSPDFLEGIMLCRKDIDKSKSALLLSQIRQVAHNFEANGEIVPSFMGKFKLTGTFI